MSESVITRRTKTAIEDVLLVDVEITSATTQVDLSGIALGKDEELVLSTQIYNPSATSWIKIFVNGNTTTTNHYNQYYYAQGTGYGANRLNNSYLTLVFNGYRSFTETTIKLVNNGYLTTQGKIGFYEGSSSFYYQQNLTSSTITFSSITSINIVAEVANAIGIGSRFQLYRRAK